MLVDHAAINKVLTDIDAYRKNTPIYQPFAENSELTDQSEAIASVFNAENMDILGQSVVDLAKDLCTQLVDSQGDGTRFKIHETALSYTREVLGTLLFGDTFAARQIMTAQRELADISRMRAIFRNMFPSLAKMAPSFFGIEQAGELSAGLTNSIQTPAPNTTLAFLCERQKKKDAKKEDPEEEELDRHQEIYESHKGERMEDLIKAKKSDKFKSSLDKDEQKRMKSLRLKQSISNMIGFYTTGLDTTASLLTSTLFMLMKNQDIQSKLREEIAKTTNGESISYSKMKEVKLLTYVIKETLRLHPPYPILYPRVSRKADRLAGFTIPKNTNVIVDVVGHNRHPKYWSNPDEFDPSRFEKNPEATKYVLSWGRGPQEKVAKSLGMLVLRCTIGTLLTKYQLVCGATDGAAKVEKIKFNRAVGSLRPTPDLIGRVCASSPSEILSSGASES